MMNRRYPERPMVGVAAIIFHGDEVLLVQRGREPAYGQWSLPGGLVKVGEELHQAVRREVLEEVGLQVEVVDVVTVLDRILYDRESRIEYHYVLVDFLCGFTGGKPVPASDVLDCRFVPVSLLPQVPLTRGTSEVIASTLKRIQGVHPPIYGPGS
jgi:ADP-ribose pyrophosphatase YjhB (NUDIX family)